LYRKYFAIFCLISSFKIIHHLGKVFQIPITTTLMGKSSFKVTMGIMPDYTFSGNGVLVDGVSDNRPAQKAGIKTGDVITHLGEFVVSDVQTYMQALNKHNKGETINVKIIRGKEEMSLSLTF
jgi:S1-C subfamily serine protease